MSQNPIVILKRPNLAGEEPEKSDKTKAIPTSKSLKEREAEYAAARKRILGSEVADQSSTSPDTSDVGEQSSECITANQTKDSPKPVQEPCQMVAPLMSLNLTLNPSALETTTGLADLELERKARPLMQQPISVCASNETVLSNNATLSHMSKSHFCQMEPPPHFHVRQHVNGLLHPFANSDVNYMRHQQQRMLPNHHQHAHAARSAILGQLAAAASQNTPQTGYFGHVPFAPNVPPPGFFSGPQQFTPAFGGNGLARPQQPGCRGRFSDPSR